MTKFFYLIITLVFNGFLVAQTITVSNIKPLENITDNSYRVIAAFPGQDALLLTKEMFSGLYRYELNTQTLQTINGERGAGYKPIFSPNGQDIYYRSYRMDGIKRYSSLKKISLTVGEIQVIEQDKRTLTVPHKTISGSISYSADNQIKNLETNEVGNQESMIQFVEIENRKIILYSKQSKKILEPLGEGKYIWPSLSPNQELLLFTLAGRGTFISDLEGNIITELGYANAPVWSEDGKWIAYMADYDDGHEIIDSEIWISSVDGQAKFQVTKTNDTHETYPVWGSGLKKLYFTSTDGNIFEATLKIE